MNIYLDKVELEQLSSMQINSGIDGTIYRLNNGTLYKIYHPHMPIKQLVSVQSGLDSEGVRIFRKEDFRQPMSYLHNPENYIKLRAEDAIKMAMTKQKDIKLTTLPLGCIYVNNRFKGTVLKDFRYALSIYSLKNLPYPIRLKVVRQILQRLKELWKYNIYPIDLACKPYHKSNILLKYNLVPEIIDLDGRSTIYCDCFISEFYQKSIYSFQCLMLELLYDFPISESYTALEILENQLLLEENKVPNSYIDSFVIQKSNLEEIEAFLQLKKSR